MGSEIDYVNSKVAELGTLENAAAQLAAEKAKQEASSARQSLHKGERLNAATSTKLAAIYAEEAKTIEQNFRESKQREQNVAQTNLAIGLVVGLVIGVGAGFIVVSLLRRPASAT